MKKQKKASDQQEAIEGHCIVSEVLNDLELFSEANGLTLLRSKKTGIIYWVAKRTIGGESVELIALAENEMRW